jgi:hypothetical protein
VRDVVRDWVASFASFVRGAGGDQRASSSVGVAFVVGALVVAVLGLRWINASGPDEKADDGEQWAFEDGSAQGDGDSTATTIPASLPANVVVVRDPGEPADGQPVVTLPDGQTGVFLPGFPPVEGGTTGTTDAPGSSTDGGGTTPTTRRPGTSPTTTRGTFPTTPTTPPPTTSPPTTSPPTTTTSPPDTTTTTAVEGGEGSGLLGLDLSGLLGALGLTLA